MKNKFNYENYLILIFTIAGILLSINIIPYMAQLGAFILGLVFMYLLLSQWNNPDIDKKMKGGKK
jgi:predicted branched-subunit amino acid permease